MRFNKNVYWYYRRVRKYNPIKSLYLSIKLAFKGYDNAHTIFKQKKGAKDE